MFIYINKYAIIENTNKHICTHVIDDKFPMVRIVTWYIGHTYEGVLTYT